MTQDKSKGKLLPPHYLFIYLLVTIVLHYLIPVAQLISSPVRYLSILLLVVGLGLGIWAPILFNKKGTAIKPFEKPSTLIFEGPFRFSRNPIYLGGVIALLSVSVYLGSLITFLAPIAFFITINKLFIPHEEKTLEETFGKEYLDYKKRVRRWI